VDNYKTIETKLANRQPFTGNSLRGYWIPLEGEQTYCVYSYNTLIATIKDGGGPRWVSTTKYSNTTTRQQNLIKRAWGI
jgi:hypothetical protein